MKLLLQTYYSYIQFIIGFICGIILDYIFYKIYTKYSHTFIYLIFIQLFLAILITLYLSSILKLKILNYETYFVRFGVLTSQLFLFDYAIKTIFIR